MTDRRILAACLAAAAFMVPAALASPPPSASMHPKSTPAATGWASPRLSAEAAAAGMIYVSNTGTNTIDIFTKSIPNQLIGQIVAGLCVPTGLATDPAGNLYAASFDAGCGASISIYAPGAIRPNRTITNGMYDPNQLAVSPQTGTVYATDSAERNILEYARGKTVLKNIVYPLGAAPSGVAIDPAGNLYATYASGASPPAQVGRYDPASRQFIDQGIPLQYAGAIAFDASGNLLVSDQRTGIITVYAAGTNTALRSFAGFSDPFAIALDAAAGVLYVADLGTRRIDELSYPAGRHLGAITGFAYNTFGLAVSPAANPALARKAP